MLVALLSARPSPLTVETREVRERSLTVQWTLAFDGGRPVTSYRVDLKSKQGTNTTETWNVQGLGVNGVLCDSASWDTAVITQVMNPELTQLTLVDLRPAKTYNLRMFATNSMGTSHTSNVLTVTTKEAGRAESHTALLCKEHFNGQFILLDPLCPQHQKVLLWT